MDECLDRLNAEWVALNAFRDLIKIASKGDKEKSNYDNSIRFAGALCPDLLGDDVSILKRERESNITREYRQRAETISIRDKEKIDALKLVEDDISEYESLLSVAQGQEDTAKHIDQLQRKLYQLYRAKNELQTEVHSENQLIFRDAYNVERDIPAGNLGQGFRDFKLSHGKILRLRVLHPDKVEHITGADLIYERHSAIDKTVAFVAVQYKIWEDRKIYLSSGRLPEQIGKLKSSFCEKGNCCEGGEKNAFRFPCCSAFLRPTDKFQKVDQKFLSTGEHLPICKIEKCKSIGPSGGELLRYEDMKDVSLSNESFEFLFSRGKIGSRELTYEELANIHRDFLINAGGHVLIQGQEFLD